MEPCGCGGRDSQKIGRTSRRHCSSTARSEAVILPPETEESLGAIAAPGLSSWMMTSRPDIQPWDYRQQFTLLIMTQLSGQPLSYEQPRVQSRLGSVFWQAQV